MALPTTSSTTVSIHAPWEGCDGGLQTVEATETEFQFTHPGKGATGVSKMLIIPPKFQFTHPGKGATVGTQQGKDINYVSIHAPWEGCDTHAASYRY